MTERSKQLPDHDVAITLEDFGGTVWFLTNAKTGAFVTAGPTQTHNMEINGTKADRFCLIQFVKHPEGYYRIWNLNYKAFCSAVGPFWPLQPRTLEASWSKFAVNLVPSTNQITIESLAPGAIAARNTWVSLPLDAHVDTRLRICETAPRPEYSYFQAYKLAEMKGIDEESRACARDNIYTGDF